MKSRITIAETSKTNNMNEKMGEIQTEGSQINKQKERALIWQYPIFISSVKMQKCAVIGDSS